MLLKINFGKILYLNNNNNRIILNLIKIKFTKNNLINFFFIYIFFFVLFQIK